jgi:hypothetical protein
MAKIAAWNGAMTFGTGGNFRNWARTGWSRPEADITWMEGTQATLEFAMPAPETDPVLSVKVLPVKTNVVQQMQIYLNGRFVALLIGKNDLEELFVPINKEYFNPDGSRNTLMFVCPNAVKPADVGAGPDQRVLSFAFIQLSLREAAK